MAIEIRKLPKWEETNTDGKLRIISNSITTLGFFIAVTLIMVTISLITIISSIEGLNSKGDIIFLIILLLISYLLMFFSIFFYTRKVK